MVIRNLLQLYALLVCLITISIMLVGVSLSLNHAIDFFMPQYRHHHSLSRYESNDRYLLSSNTQSFYDPGFTKEKIAFLKTLPPEQLSLYREKDKAQVINDIKVEDLMDFMSTTLWVCVALIFFVIHWRLYKKEAKTTKK